MRQCRKCKIVKPTTEFYRMRGGYLYVSCKNCHSLACAKVNSSSRERINSLQSWRMLRYKYGITREQYEAMFAKQGGVCAGCKSAVSERLRVDHDHDSGEVRGLLCSKCNSSLGFVGDNPETAFNLAVHATPKFKFELRKEFT